MQSSSLENFCAEIKNETGSNLNLLLFYKDETSILRLSEDLKEIYWEKSFSLKILCIENKQWNYFENDFELYHYIINSVKENSFSLKKNEENNFIFQLFVLKKVFSITLESKKGVVEKKLETMFDKFTSIEANLDEFQKRSENLEKNAIEFNKNLERLEKSDKISKKNEQIEEVLQSKIKAIEKIIEKNKINEEKFNGIDQFLEKFAVNMMSKMEILNKTIQKFEAYSGDMENRFNNLEERIKKNDELLIQNNQMKLIQNNNTYYFNVSDKTDFIELSNNNRTVEKIVLDDHCCGVRCNPSTDKISDKLTFSIQIDNLDSEKCDILFGWCLKSAQASDGYFGANDSLAFELSDGTFLKEGICHGFFDEKKNIKVSKNQIYTTIFNIKERRLYIYLNGELCGMFHVFNEEIEFLCPFVDLHYKGEKVSIIDDPPLNYIK